MRRADSTASNHHVSEETAPSVLVLAYAFPPLQIPMAPVVARIIAGLHQLGVVVDVICPHPDASSFTFPRDESLCEYVDSHCRSIQRLWFDSALLRVFTQHRPFMRHFPDCMAGIQDVAFRAVMAAEPDSYSAVLTISPFHSVNPVMVRVKKARPHTRWIAHFGDPWANNPLEERRLARRWNGWHESQTLRAADYVTHTSEYALEMVLKASPFLQRERTRVVPHEFDQALYPSRQKRLNDRVTLRYIGTLFGRRSPTPLFRALRQLSDRRPDIRDSILVELIGPMDRHLSAWEAIGDLPAGMVQHRHAVDYVESLALMYDADLLLLIEADIASTPFVPSKLMDYLGANTPVIGLVPSGGCHGVLERVGCLIAQPDDISGIATILEQSIDRVMLRQAEVWCRDDVRRSFGLTSATSVFLPLIMENGPQ